MLAGPAILAATSIPSALVVLEIAGLPRRGDRIRDRGEVSRLRSPLAAGAARCCPRTAQGEPRRRSTASLSCGTRPRGCRRRSFAVLTDPSDLTQERRPAGTVRP